MLQGLCIVFFLILFSLLIWVLSDTIMMMFKLKGVVMYFSFKNEIWNSGGLSCACSAGEPTDPEYKWSIKSINLMILLGRLRMLCFCELLLDWINLLLQYLCFTWIVCLVLHSLLIMVFSYCRCAICLSEYRNGQWRIYLRPCNHVYHAFCITPWLKINKVRKFFSIALQYQYRFL